MDKEEFKEELRRILRRDNSYAVEDWKHPIMLIHNGIDERKTAFSKINEAIKCADLNGVYVYMKDECCLYVGKGKLIKRLHSHYLESLPGCKLAKKWCKFFGNKENLGEMKIFWKEMCDRKAKVIEQMLTYVLEPKFYLKKKKDFKA
jgi:hypothetical protein